MNIKNWDIYLSRLVSAFCLFLILSEANIWLNPLSNTILVLGYRLFIIFTPFFFLFFRHKLTFIAFVILEAGLLSWLLHFTFVGTILFAIGVSVSGFMLKYYSSFSTKGAAGNKIALNLGSIFSGVVLAASQNMNSVITLCIFAMFISFMSFAKYYYRENISQFNSTKTHFKLNGLFTRSGVSWALIGFVIGVKLIAIVSILPQFLINSNGGKLPAWFGGMLVLNSLIVVIFQMPVMHRIKNFGKVKAIIPLFLGMVIIMLSNALGISNFYGALIWTVALSIVECAVSYLDKLSQDDGFLLIKESSVGIGSAVSVYLVRSFNPQQGSLLIGSLSMILLVISILLFSRKHLVKKLSYEIRDSLHS